MDWDPLPWYLSSVCSGTSSLYLSPNRQQRLLPLPVMTPFSLLRIPARPQPAGWGSGSELTSLGLVLIMVNPRQVAERWRWTSCHLSIWLLLR